MRADIAQMAFIELTLRTVALSIENEFGVEFTSTSFFRMDDLGVHGTMPLRGIDLRCPNRDFGLIVQRYINGLWGYDPKRPDKMVCKYHNAGSGWHLHIQVHPNTVKRLT